MPSIPEPIRTPGQLLASLIEARGWTQRVLALVTGIQPAIVNRLVTDRRPVDAVTALRLAEVLDVQPEQLLELQAAFDLAKARFAFTPDPARAQRARLFAALPVAEMVKRSWLRVDDLQDAEQVERAILEFFGVGSIDDIAPPAHAARRTDALEPLTAAQHAWLQRVRSIAAEMLVARYSPAALAATLPRLAELRSSPELTRKVPRLLMEAGVRLVLVESLAGTKIDGACLWLGPEKPVIGLTLRFDRIDNFWFVLRHEIEHVLQGHGQAHAIVDAELEGDRAGVSDTIAEEERVANRAAAEFCVPAAKLESFILRKAPFFAERDLIGFATTLGVHPGIVAGQLQRRTGRYDRHRGWLVKVRGAIAPSAVVDGWGDVAPVGA